MYLQLTDILRCILPPPSFTARMLRKGHGRTHNQYQTIQGSMQHKDIGLPRYPHSLQQFLGVCFSVHEELAARDVTRP